MGKILIMKKIIFGLIATFALFNLSFGQTPSNEEVYKHLQSKYNFEKISFNVNESSNETLINSLKNDNFIMSELSLSEIDLSNVSIIFHSVGIKSLLIPYIKNSRHNLVVSINGSDYKTLLKSSIVKNDIDSIGNGTLSYSSSTDKFSDSFVNGKKDSSTTAKKSCFRKCFDEGYDTICDGIIGCASWYSSPLPALTTVAYCGVKCA